MIETDRDEEREQRNGVQVLARAATILRLLAADSSGGLTFSELVARSGLPRTTVHRIRGALEHEDFIYTDAATGRLHLGPGIMRLAMANRATCRRSCGPTSSGSRASSTRPSTSACSTACTCCSSRSIPRRSGRSWSSRASARGSRPTAPPTARRCSRSCPRTRSSAVSPRGSRRRARHTPVSRKALLAELDEVRATGLGFDREEHRAGICGVGRGHHRHRRQLGVHLGADAGGALPRGPRTAVAAALLRVRDEVQIALHNG